MTQQRRVKMDAHRGSSWRAPAAEQHQQERYSGLVWKDARLEMVLLLPLVALPHQRARRSWPSRRLQVNA